MLHVNLCAMACPYFDPDERVRGSSGSLGDLYTGECRAGGWRPDEQTIFDRCNLGYARGSCAHFPASDGPDAVRFSVSKDDRTAIKILYSIERDHRPFSNGALEFSTAAGGFAAAPESIERLASAYVRSYLRRTR
jgi:hypothetical protein